MKQHFQLMIRISICIVLLLVFSISCQDGKYSKKAKSNSFEVDICFNSSSIKLGQSYEQVAKSLKGRFNKDDLFRESDVEKTIWAFDTLRQLNVNIPYSSHFSFRNDILKDLTIYFNKNLEDNARDILSNYLDRGCNIKIEMDTVYYFKDHKLSVYLDENIKQETSITISYRLNSRSK